jgi:putative transposase
MTYSIEFRRAVAAAYEDSESSAEVAERFACSESWVRRLIQRQRETGSLEPRPPQLPNNFKLDEAELAELGELITAKPDMTLEELAAALSKKVSVSTVHRATKKLKLTLKKSPSTPRNRTGRM